MWLLPCSLRSICVFSIVGVDGLIVAIQQNGVFYVYQLSHFLPNQHCGVYELLMLWRTGIGQVCFNYPPHRFHCYATSCPVSVIPVVISFLRST
jgi:hypothetical protein